VWASLLPQCSLLVRFSKYEGMSSEEIYDILYENAEKIDISSLIDKMLDEHLDGEGDGDGEEDESGKKE
jgi:hypothetical protein